MRAGLHGPAVSCAGVVEVFVRGSDEGALLTLRVSPSAKKSSVEGAYGDHALKLRIAATPVDGKANAETEKFLAKQFGLPRSEVSVVRGASSQDKVVLLRDIEPEKVSGILAAEVG